MDTIGIRLHVTEELARQWGENVAKRRDDLRLNQRGLAELIGGGVAVQTISKLERGEIVPRDYLKIAIALALQIEVDDLFPMPDRKRLARFTRAIVA